jgi:hypothetical protein
VNEGAQQETTEDTEQEPIQMRVVCAWCEKVVVEGDLSFISHTVCDACMALHFPEIWNDVKTMREASTSSIQHQVSSIAQPTEASI